jgi:nucleoside-diphosphate-sugar epimerase
MRILITGGTGFIGSRLAQRCIERGDSVKVLGQVNTPAEAENRHLIEKKGAEIILGSVTDPESLSGCLEGVDIVYHLAAAQHEMNVPDQKFRDVNVDGTRSILEFCLSTGVRRFVHGSTIGVYGSLEGAIDEKSPCNPDNIYGVTKLEGERVVLSYQERLPVVLIRIPEVYGPGDRRLLKLFKAIKKGAFMNIGPGRNLHHPIYVDDLIDGLFLAAEKEEAPSEIILLAGKEPVTTNEMVAIIAEHVGAAAPKWRVPLFPMLLLATVMEKSFRPLGIQPPLHRRRMDFFRKSFVLRGEKAQSILGFVPKVTFKYGALQTSKWYEREGYL